MKDIKQIREEQQKIDSQIVEDHEFSMARSELKSIISNAQNLLGKLKGEGDLEAWMQSKITKAADYLTAVHDNIAGGESETEKLDEVKKQDGYFTKHDPRVKKGFPSDKKIPNVLVLKRKAIRVYPDDQKVALYYSQVLDKYITIPFGENVPGINEENIQELDTQTYQKAAVKRAAKEPKKSDYDSDEDYEAALAKHNAKMNLYKKRIKKSSATDIPWQETKAKIKAVRKQKDKDKDGEKGKFISGLRPDDPVYSAGYALGYGATKALQGAGVLARPAVRAIKTVAGRTGTGMAIKAATPAAKKASASVKNFFRPLDEPSKSFAKKIDKNKTAPAPVSAKPSAAPAISPTIKSGGEQPNIPSSYGKNVDIPVQKPLSPEAKLNAPQPAQPKMFSPTAPKTYRNLIAKAPGLGPQPTIKESFYNKLDEESLKTVHQTLNEPSSPENIERIKKQLQRKKENINKLDDVLAKHEKTKEIEQKAKKGEISSQELEKHYKENPAMLPQNIKQLKKVKSDIKSATPESVARETEKAAGLSKMTVPGLATSLAAGFKEKGKEHLPQAAADVGTYAAGRAAGAVAGKILGKFMKPGKIEPFRPGEPGGPGVIMKKGEEIPSAAKDITPPKAAKETPKVEPPKALPAPKETPMAVKPEAPSPKVEPPKAFKPDYQKPSKPKIELPKVEPEIIPPSTKTKPYFKPEHPPEWASSKFKQKLEITPQATAEKPRAPEFKIAEPAPASNLPAKVGSEKAPVTIQKPDTTTGVPAPVTAPKTGTETTTVTPPKTGTETATLTKTDKVVSPKERKTITRKEEPPLKTKEKAPRRWFPGLDIGGGDFKTPGPKDYEFKLKPELDRAPTVTSQQDPLTRSPVEMKKYVKSFMREEDVDTAVTPKARYSFSSYTHLKDTNKGRSRNIVSQGDPLSVSPIQAKQYYRTQTNESIIDQIKELATKTDLTNNMLIVNEEQIDINSNIAEKVIQVYEALNDDNKAKFAKMLGESKQSFQKAVNFALRYKNG